MKILSQILRKDLRDAAMWIVLSSCAWLPMLALPAFSWDVNRSVFLYISLLVLGTCVGFFAVAKIVQSDPPLGAAGFLSTRPISRVRIAAAKIALIVIAIVVPGAIIRALAFLLAGAGVSPGLFAELFAQQFAGGLAFAVIFLVPALATSSLQRAIIATIVSGCVLFALALAAFMTFPITSLSASSLPLRVLAFQVAFGAGTLLAALLLAKSRRISVGVITLVLTLAGSFALLRFWIPSPPAAPLPPSAKAVVQTPPVLRSDLGGEGPVENLVINTTIENLPKGQIALPVSATTTFTSESGQKTLHMDKIWSDRDSDESDDRRIADWLGIPSSDSRRDSGVSITLATEPQASNAFDGIDLSTVRGRFSCDVLQAKLIASLPPRVGAEVVSPPYRIRIEQVSATGNSLGVEVAIRWLQSPLSSQPTYFFSSPTFRIVARNIGNPSQILKRSSGSGDRASLGPLHLVRIGTGVYPSGDNSSLPADLENSIRIQVVATEFTGRETLPFESPSSKPSR
jgi:hypothetical protein